MKRKREQSGQVFQRHGSWYVRFYENRFIDGVVKRVRVAKRLAEVTTRGKRPPATIEQDAKRAVAGANNPKYSPEHVVTLEHFVEQVYFARIEEHRRPSTVKGYRDIWECHLKPRCSGIWLKDVQTFRIQQILDDIARPGVLGRRTLQHIKCSLSGIFKLAKQQGYFVGENPVRDTAVSPRAKEPKETHAYTLDEIRGILAVLPEPAATIFSTAAFTGLRRGEIRGLRWEDYRNNEIHVSQSVWRDHVTAPKTYQSRGAVPVIGPLAKMLDALRARCGNPQSGPMFAATNGKPVDLNNVLGRKILPALERCEVCHKSRAEHLDNGHTFKLDASLPKWHGWHAARRGLGSNLYALGVPEKTIQVILRHANVSTTATYYIKSAPADAQAAMAKLEGAVPQLGNEWATDGTSTPKSVAVN
jgi:integrase